ncbi:polyadenylate-binding protein rbp45 [Phtheirospermum japonicum]|uniref:Polyadenylate-binding protein rbp45 n=1 Tax=Phtheirospermum japonicum TaxID=374723 RepID=A0A830CPP0_9LAMI|nr:polyadenylate-binding protein rbp45 [Phtheirospermum japonicum]
MMQQPGGIAPPAMGMDQQQQPPQQQQYPPQQWMMMPPQQQHQPAQAQPPQYWPQQQQQPYGAAPANAAPAGGGTDEVRSLWIGDLQYWMDENYLTTCFYNTGELVSAKVIRNKQTGQCEGYGFLEFRSHAAAETILQSYNGAIMPNSEQSFRMNWASLGAGDKRTDNSPEHTIFVGDLAGDVTDYLLQETFKSVYQSVKGAKVVTDRITGRSKGYGFVKFGDEREQQRAMTEMNGVPCSTRAMRVGPAANKKPMTAAPTQTVSLSALYLRWFSLWSCAEQALSTLNGTMLGGQNIRLSWGRNPSSKQSDQSQWAGPGAGAGGYYGYTQGYEGHGGYAAPPQDPSMYYGGYPGYGNYQQPQQ